MFGFEFTVVLPDGTETDAKIKVRGQNSPVVKAFGRKTFKEMQMREQRAKRTGKDEELSLEEAEEFGYHLPQLLHQRTSFAP